MLEVLVRRQQRLLFPEPSLQAPAPDSVVRGFLLDIALLGYTLDAAATRALRALDRLQLQQLHHALIPALREQTGARGYYTPLFVNFPFDVPDQYEYLLARVDSYLQRHYGLGEAKALSCGHVVDPALFQGHSFGACPICQRQVDPIDLPRGLAREPLREKTPLRLLTVGTQDDARLILGGLLRAKTSLSELDLEDVQTLFAQLPDPAEVYVVGITFRETLAHVAQILYRVRPAEAHLVDAGINTVTDVLRIAAAFSEGDVSLAQPTHFRRFTRAERRYLLGRIERVLAAKNGVDEDFQRWVPRWKRLARALHPGDYAQQFPLTAAAFKQLHEGPKLRTFNSQVETGLQQHHIEQVLTLLVTRPGELARRLSHLLRVGGYAHVYPAFTAVANRLPTPLLLQLYAHFHHLSEQPRRKGDEEPGSRYFLPKGSLAKLFVTPDTRPEIPAFVAEGIAAVAQTALLNRFAHLPSLGTVTIDPKLKGYLVPQSQRSASRSLRQLTRGSRVSLPDSPVIRAFMHWQEPEGNRTDLDLSAVFYAADWTFKGSVSYMNLSQSGCAHSGDVQSAPCGAAEYLDIPRSKLLANGVRYVALSVISYNSVPFNRLPEAFAGLMGRERPEAGALFDARTVIDRFDVTAEATSVVPYVLDLEAGELIWCDLALGGSNHYQNVATQSRQIAQRAQAIFDLGATRPTLYDLFRLHALARSQAGSEQTTVFAEHEGIQPTDTATILGLFLQ